MSRLIVINKKAALDFQFSDAIDIGRHISNSLPLPDPEASRRHAQIYPKQAGFAITDLKSRNGLTVNGKETAECELKKGDEIIIGHSILLFDPPEGRPPQDLLSPRGSALWDLFPKDRKLEIAEATCFSRPELDEMIQKWLKRTETTPLIPYKLRSNFLEFALTLDHHKTRGDLCLAGLRFLEERISAQRMIAIAPDPKNQRMEILSSLTEDPDHEEIVIDKDILRVVLHSQRGAYCHNTADDFRYRYLAQSTDPYRIQSFVAAPIFCGERYYGFLYVDHPIGGPKYTFKSLVQAHLTASLLGKCLHWLKIARKKK